MVSFFLNEVHNKILMEEHRYNGIDLDNVAEMLAVRNGIIILKILELL